MKRNLIEVMIMSEQQNNIVSENALFVNRNTDLGNSGEIKRSVKNKRLSEIRKNILNSDYNLCIQKARLMTEYFKKNSKMNIMSGIISAIHYHFYKSGLKKSNKLIKQKNWQVKLNNQMNRFYLKRESKNKSEIQIEFAKALDYTLKNMKLKVYDNELIVGNPSSARVGAPIHPELGGMLMLPEIETLHKRRQNPISTDIKDIGILKKHIFPFWFNKSILALTPLYSNNSNLFNTMLDGSLFVLTQFSGISHVTPDYPAVLKYGFSGIIKKITKILNDLEEKIEGNDLNNKYRNKYNFYRAAYISANAAIDYGKRWSNYLQVEASKTADIKRRDELLELSNIFKNVPEHPASTFHEALQSIFTAHVILHQECFQHGISFGRMDQYLYPYYKRGIENGTLTKERAVELLGCFIAKAGELIPLFFNRATGYFSGMSSASGITLGGKTKDGRDAVNDLSHLILQAYDCIRLRQPNFHIRVHRETNQKFMDLCYNTLKGGGGLPAFFNDEEIIPALEQNGLSAEDAGDYSIVGCVEWGSPGKSFPAAGAAFINMPMALQLALHNGFLNGERFGPETGPVDSFKTADELLEAFNTQLDHLLDIAVEGNNAIEKAHAIHRPTPFLSIIVDGCIDKGKEVNDGGAIYNTTGCQGVGIADLIDSFTAIDKLVFKENKLSLKELVNAADNNYAEESELRHYIMNRIPKYGQNNVEADNYAKLLSGIYAEYVHKKTNPRSGKYSPGFWTMTTHQGFGNRMGALPGGRLSGEPLANGASPCNGMDNAGPTASMVSASHLKGQLITNGYALNQKINYDFIKSINGNSLLDGLIRGFFNIGGMQVQFNIIDPEILNEAKNNPEKYPDLVVRVSGYSAYFNDLNESMKDEIINRTMHYCGSCS